MKNITPDFIFEKKQVLTMEKAKQLIGQKIAITNPEYSANKPSVRVFTLLGIESEWDLAAKEPMEGYSSRQEYWADNISKRIPDFKSRLKLVTDGDIAAYATCDTSDNYTFDEPTFFGSDSDRAIFYCIA